MISVQDHSRLCQKCLSITLSDFFLSSKTEFSNQSIEPLRQKLPIAIVPIATFAILKHIKKNL